MTIEVKDIASKFKHLKNILNDPDISEMEASLMVEIGVHIISGNRTKAELMSVFENTKCRRKQDIDELQVLRYLAQD